ncbi:MAG: 4'-phosphopantetheinyl transferase superfamily protein, partial [Verrucomicrobia bacterium]|nr:4'-phosphopantetheinyl transferase superfamily protein [Verrucomicrobiota bacterium]
MITERILSLGTDLVEISRIEDSLTEFGDRFLEKIFLPEEIAY